MWENLTLGEKTQAIREARMNGVKGVENVKQYYAGVPGYTSEEYLQQDTYADGGQMNSEDLATAQNNWDIVNTYNLSLIDQPEQESKNDKQNLLRQAYKFIGTAEDNARWNAEYDKQYGKKQTLAQKQFQKPSVRIPFVNTFEYGGPTKRFNKFRETLPDNQRLTPLDKYDMFTYWKLNGRPKDFESAMQMEHPMFNFDESDNSYHASTLAWDRRNNGHFVKPKDHDTVGYELDYFNKGIITEEGGVQREPTKEEKAEWEYFRNHYDLTDDPKRPNFYMYKRKGRRFDLGGFTGPDDPEELARQLRAAVDASYRNTQAIEQDNTNVSIPIKKVTKYSPNLITGKLWPIDFLSEYVKSEAFENKAPSKEYINTARENIQTFNRIRTPDTDSPIQQKLQKITSGGLGYSPHYNTDKNVIFSTNEGVDYALAGSGYKEKIHTYEDDVLAHEFGHVIDPNEIDYTTKRKFEAPLRYKNLTQGYRDALDGTLGSKKTMNNTGNKLNSHDAADPERYADLQAFRYKLYKTGIYDARSTELFTIEMMKAARKIIKDDRLMDTYDDSEIVRLMNTIAQNNVNDNNMVNIV